MDELIVELENELAVYEGDKCSECGEYDDFCTCPPDDTAAQLRHEMYDDMKGANL